MKMKTLLLAISLILAVPAFAQEQDYQTDPATVDAIRAAAKRMASAAESVRVALETNSSAEKPAPAASSR